MATHLDDHAQLEALKRWWNNNALQLVGLVVIVAGGWFGWHWWQDQQHSNAEEGALVYTAMLDELGQWEQEQDDSVATRIVGHAEMLKSLDDDSLYARYGALTIARIALATGDTDTAASELRWVIDTSPGEALKSLAAFRLARVEVARGNDQAALELLAESPPEEMTSLYAELKGDIQVRQGDLEAARASYQRALDTLDPAVAASRPLLKLKLSQVMPAEAVSEPAKEENAG